MKRLLVSMLALGCCGSAFAETVAAPIQPALFVVRDADSTLYLFGTVHVRRPGAPWGGEDARSALASADEIWTEMEMSAEAEAQAQRIVVSLGVAPPDRPLSTWLNADEAQRLADLTQRLGIPANYLEPMQPWLAALTLSLAPMMQAGYDPLSGVDRAIDAEGDATGKRMRAFETAQEQLQFLAGLSEAAQREMLLDAIAETEAGPTQLDALSIAWEQGDLDQIEQVVVQEMRVQYPELYDVLFRRRNTAWVDVLMQELDGAGVDFVAVGSGHLVGEDGIVTLLRARGVSVERVSPAE